MAKILINFAHPVFSKSVVQRQLVNRCKALGNVTFNDLYEHYPDLYIDVRREQELLQEHDIIVWQHPMYWYSSPAILKQWMDLVLEYNWAYGPLGNKLAGKKVLSVISCGVRESAYSAGGINRHDLGQYLLPFRQTAVLCGMEYLPPFVVFGSNQISGDKLEEQADRYARLLTGLAAGIVSEQQLNAVQYLHEMEW